MRSVHRLEGHHDLVAAVAAEVYGDGRRILVPAAGLSGSIPECGPGGAVVCGYFHVVVVFIFRAEEHVAIKSQIGVGRAVEGGCDQPFILMVVIPVQAGLEFSLGGSYRITLDGERACSTPGGIDAECVCGAGVGDDLSPFSRRESVGFEALGDFQSGGIGRLPGNEGSDADVIHFGSYTHGCVSHLIEGDLAHIVVCGSHGDLSVYRRVATGADVVIVSMIGKDVGNGENACRVCICVVGFIASELDDCTRDSRTGIAAKDGSAHGYLRQELHGYVDGEGVVFGQYYGLRVFIVSMCVKGEVVGFRQHVAQMVLSLCVGGGAVGALVEADCHAAEGLVVCTGDGSVDLSHTAGDSHKDSLWELAAEAAGGRIGGIVGFRV